MIHLTANSASVVNKPFLYLSGNGMCTCRAHLGQTARQTGRDIDGQEIVTLFPADAMELGLRCEVCPR